MKYCDEGTVIGAVYYALRTTLLGDDSDKAKMAVAVEIVKKLPTADVREVMEADGYTHLICPHCLSEFYAKTKAEMFCPNCGKKIFFSEKWVDFPYKGENIPQGNGLP